MEQLSEYFTQLFYWSAYLLSMTAWFWGFVSVFVFIAEKAIVKLVGSKALLDAYIRYLKDKVKETKDE